MAEGADLIMVVGNVLNEWLEEEGEVRSGRVLIESIFSLMLSFQVLVGISGMKSFFICYHIWWYYIPYLIIIIIIIIINYHLSLFFSSYSLSLSPPLPLTFPSCIRLVTAAISGAMNLSVSIVFTTERTSLYTSSSGSVVLFGLWKSSDWQAAINSIATTREGGRRRRRGRGGEGKIMWAWKKVFTKTK